MGTTGQVVLGGIGAVVGGYFGQAQGAQIGWTVGYSIGTVIDPGHIPGPRLGDAGVQTSRDGVPIPIGWGIFSVIGNVIQQNPITREQSDVDSGKKGSRPR